MNVMILIYMTKCYTIIYLDKTPTEELSPNSSMDASVDSVDDGAKNISNDVICDISKDAVADVATDSDDAVRASNQPEMSEMAMRYLEKLFEKHEQNIKERFSAT